MSTFTALNIEADDHSDDEVDNTKEIQIEEAFRLYQIALNLHKQGPDLYPQAEQAYRALFRSEIFSYPESISEFDRTDGPSDLDFDAESNILQAAEPSDDIPNTLPQILYLAYKNYGLLLLHMLKHDLRRSIHPNLQISNSQSTLPKEYILRQARAALDCFGKALVWDESDTDLWRSAARIANFLGSKRAARYALEAAAETDDDPALGEVLPPALGEGFAGEQLKELLGLLSDEVALQHPSLEPYRTKSLNAQMKKYMDPYPFLPQSAQSTPELQTILDNVQPTQREINVTERSWKALGEALAQLRLHDSSTTRYLIKMPPDVMPTVESPALDHVMSDAAPPQASNSPTPIEQSMPPVEIPKADNPQPTAQNAQAIDLPSRKRSHSTIGGADTPEEEAGAAKRSRRIRNRDANGDGSKQNPAADGLEEMTKADTHLFKVASNILERLGAEGLGAFEDFKDAMIPKSPATAKDNLGNTALRDLRAILASWDETKAPMVLSGDVDEIFGSARGKGLDAGMKAFLEHSKPGPLSVNTMRPFPPADGLPEFLDHVEKNWMILQDLTILWLQSLYQSYREYSWSESMKNVVRKVVLYADAEILEYLSSETKRLSLPGADLAELSKVQEMIQMLFELHLWIYSSVTEPASTVSITLRVQEKDRLARWLDLAGDIQNALDPRHLPLELELRYHWARAYFVSTVGDAEREHIISQWANMHAILTYANNITIELQNNDAMPEISAAAAERELSRLTSMDLFMNLFRADQADPSAVIETLEPILDPSCIQTSETNSPDVDGSQAAASKHLPQAFRDMWKFLQGGKASLRIFLWTRLREAYEGIEYKTKVFSCHLKSIEVIVADLQSQSYIDSPPEARYPVLLKWLQALDLLLVRALTIALNDSTAFEIIDDAHIRSTSSALAHLSRILHCAAVFDDEIQLGVNQLPRTHIYGPHGSFNVFFNKLKEMQVRAWALQYTMIKEGMSQNREMFPAIDTDLAEYMAAVHYALGIRKWCKASNKIFLKMMKLEMVRLKNVELWEDYLGQVLFDLYGIKLGPGKFLITDHCCPTETLDKRTTQLILPFVVTLANRMSVKDLLKSELRPTIERMQQAIGPTRSNSTMAHNLRNYTEYLKGPINPLKFFQALKGQVLIDSLPVLNSDSPLAEQGWFFLQGDIALAKYRMQKKVGPGALDDLKIAATFFRLQVQFTPEHWETWYRLAQCFDLEMLEDILWSADKMNDARQDLVHQQRNAIHCFIMAVSTAMRSADATFETAGKLSDLYKDFGMRIYSSSREPFSMEAFYLDGFDRHFSGRDENITYKKAAYDELSRYQAWHYAAKLFRRVLLEKPEDWHTHYMYGKCLWKMYHKFSTEADPTRYTRPSMSLLLSTLKKAVTTVPKPRDSRSEPILEPHYKILSIVHKLVLCGDLDHQAGADILQDRPYAFRKGERVEVNNAEEWEDYVLDSLRHLRSADKSNWHHRMIARQAYILHDPEKQDFVSASSARHVLCQSMFTKTMVVNVWKNDWERHGRHHVYMERYVRYMIKILFQINEKKDLDLLARRIKKKSGQYFKFNDVWAECCTALYKLIRRHGQIPMNRDELFKTVSPDDFKSVAERINSWIRDPRTSHSALDSLREIQELRKLNGGTMKTVPLDDLMLDIYAVLYFDVGVNIPSSALPAPTLLSGPMSLGNMMNLEGAIIIDQDPSRPPKLGISRREILRTAEAAANQLLEQERTAAAARFMGGFQADKVEPSKVLPSNGPDRRDPPLNVENRVVISVPSSRHVSTPGIDGDTEMADANVDVSTRGGDAVGAREPSSEPGSLHDSADDESDLSDVPNMDDEDDAAIFPDLVRPSNHTVSTPIPANSSNPWPAVPDNHKASTSIPAYASPSNPRPAIPDNHTASTSTPANSSNPRPAIPRNVRKTPSNPLPAIMPGGVQQGKVLYTRPETVDGWKKLIPAPVGDLPQWESLPTKDYTMSTDGSTRYNINDTVWTHVAVTPRRKVKRLAKILDIRVGKTPENEEIDHLIVAWYWHKKDIDDHAYDAISIAISDWPDQPEGKKPFWVYVLSNHRDVLVPGSLLNPVEPAIVNKICPESVFLVDGVSDLVMIYELECVFGKFKERNIQRWVERLGWLERARLSKEGVMKPVGDTETSAS